tara:strand:- start:32 stop:424 length:393 start_codon:yes stop_codon:yes gene_type:complete
MANGTIAFDTLQTSGQITGTAKSVDTDFVVNGSAKAWVGLDSGSIEDSFNLASMTDNDTADYTSTFSNSMSNATYSQTNHFFFEGTGTSHGFVSQNADRATGSLRSYGRRNTSGTLGDTEGCVTVHGDLA